MSAPTDAEGRLRVLCEKSKHTDWRSYLVSLADIKAVLALLHEKDRLLATALMMEEQANSYHRNVYGVFERYCKDRIALAPIPDGKSLGQVLTEELGERAEAAERTIREKDEYIRNQDIGWQGADKRAAAAERALAEHQIVTDSSIIGERIAEIERRLDESVPYASRAPWEVAFLLSQVGRLQQELQAARQGLFHRITGWDKNGQTLEQILDEVQELRNALAERDAALAALEAKWRGYLAQFAESAGPNEIMAWEQIANDLAALRRPHAPGEPEMVRHTACPCLHTTPCHPRCTCVMPHSSSGCQRCCRYGSEDQQRAQAERLAALTPDVLPAFLAKLRGLPRHVGGTWAQWIDAAHLDALIHEQERGK